MPDLVETPDNEPAIQAAQILNGHSIERTPSKSSKENDSSPPEVRNFDLHFHFAVLYALTNFLHIFIHF